MDRPDHAPRRNRNPERTCDTALLAGYADGDRYAARELTARHLPRVLGFAARMLDDPAEAEDVAQEVMLRLWRIAPRWQPERARISTWLYRVTANLCIDRLRRRRLRRGVPIADADEPLDTRPGALSGLIAADRATALQAALGRLPQRQRMAVVLRHLEGLANPEIAVVMDSGVEAVESLIARGRRTLTVQLATHRDELGYDDE